MPKGSRRTYRTGLSRAAIVDAALALTAERGLDGWSMRDLTARLDTSLSVIYHHVGDRGRVCAAVVDRVYADMGASLDETDWRKLLYGVLSAMIDHMARYPGVAAWLLRNGPQTEQLIPVLDAGITCMLDAGWGDEAADAYSIAFNTTLGLIALGDQRVGENADLGIAGLQHLIAADPAAGRGAKQMQRMVEQFVASDAAQREAVQREYCRYALDRVLDGLEVRLHALRTTG
ncbi:TetR family transcriptional regulator [Nocardia uniformis]|uniref:TetR family transcriptional regulator n=1 Tax=Nocardia uniformis TaxID=53432 RepID=A0A849CB97_9NOCA|nr:TetR family transcriptional regulator [Nocardia uniformis]NNH73600.1 TetR family transcriptional regulator [Nocardia uniformis]